MNFPTRYVNESSVDPWQIDPSQIRPWDLTQRWSKHTQSDLFHQWFLVVLISRIRLGLFLQKYKSGPLPKPFKIIPTLPAWARILALTEPENWSPHACRAATRLFISTMKPPQAQLFLSVVLLDAVREDIQENKRLNVQYYEALKRALYKPGAFFKGILFPMLEVLFPPPNPTCSIYRHWCSKDVLWKRLQSLHLSSPK